MANLRAGLIGLGMMGRHHARILDDLDGVDLVAVCDANGDPHGVAKGREILADVEALVKAGLDYCVVAAPTALHEEIGLQLANAGVATMVEKPVAHDTQAGARLAEAFESAGVLGAVGHVERYNPALQEARRRLNEGQLGEIFQIATRRQSPFPARISDVGVAFDLASHDIDLTTWLGGAPYEYISSATAFRSGRNHEDLVAAQGRLKNGVIVNHLVNWVTPFKERLTIITGVNGVFVADTLMADLTFYANGKNESSWVDIAQFRGVSEGEIIRYELLKKEPLLTEHENLRDAVLGKDADIVTMRQGLQTIHVCEALVSSGQDGTIVRFEA